MESKSNNKYLFAALTIEILMVSLAFLAGYLSKTLLGSEPASFPILNQAYGILIANGIKAMPSQKAFEYGAIRGMLQAYDDPYTSFLEPPQNELQTNQLEGKYGGIGARIEKDTNNQIILFPLPNSPSSKAGIEDADHLLAVEQLNINSDTKMDDIQAALRGPVGTSVSLIIARQPDYKPFSISVSRAEYSLPSVTWNLLPENQQIGVVRINILAATTPGEVSKAFHTLQDKGARYFILDLRDDAGGLVDAGIETTNLFLSGGTIIAQQYRDQPVKAFTIQQGGEFSKVPLVLLVNHGTASAAEIIAGALQAQKRALLIGAATYGKDSIQLVFNLKDGSSIHVTSAHWWIPGGAPSLDGKGLQPDISIPDDEAHHAELIQTAIQNLTQ
jgi:carboxyl-terminal processing protease